MQNPNYPQDSATAIGAKFIMKTRNGRKLTQTATNGIIEDSKLLVQNTNHFKAKGDCCYKEF